VKKESKILERSIQGKSNSKDYKEKHGKGIRNPGR
jgi:hypothetical protein